MLKNLFQQQSLVQTVVNAGLMTASEYEALMSQKADEQSEENMLINHFASDLGKYKKLAEILEVKIVNLMELGKITPDLINEIPRKILTDDKLFPFAYGNNERTILHVASANPTDQTIIDNLEMRTGKTIVLFMASDAEIERMSSRYYGDVDAMEAANEYISGLSSIKEVQTEDLTSGDSPVIKIVNSLLDQAARMKASDIHIEPFEDRLKIRYRIDGALSDRPSYPIELHSNIIARLKIMSNIDISEKRIPQDGRLTHMVDKVEYDVRVSMLPTVYGQKCVMRLAIRENLQRDKRDLGLTDYDLNIFNRIFANPNGIILVTGPTGSGKSTTLYTALSELSTEEVNVVTVEDPVEANVPGVNQVQTNTRAGLTFASALRSILRQDPDIIMIGEIRDGETAEIAVQAAITGHLVVSTLHTNSASASVSRLVNMGIEPYLVADAIVGILAQRLVRKLCPRCKKERFATIEEIRELGLKEGVKNVKIYDRGGCAYCNNTGFSGRTAVYEIMEVGPEIKRLINNNASSEQIKTAAVKNGMHTLHRSAAALVVKGLTTMSEMRKVSNET